jgi:hypothetical protein
MLFVGFLTLTFFLLSGTVLAEGNKYGVAGKRLVNFSDPVRVGEVLLPAGDYEVRHTVEGDNHVMVFKQLAAKRPAGTSVKCSLVPLDAPVSRDEVGFTVNAGGEYVLHRLAFKGDRAAHLF